MTRNAVFNRLPGGDRTTTRSELAVFASLGLAGAMMVALALADMSHFLAGSDRVTQALSGRQESLATARPADDGRTVATNPAGAVVPRVNARTAAPDKV